jgi:hypothetical protein
MSTWHAPAVPLSELHRIRRWHVEHAKDHPVEYQLWDAVITCWLMGWVGWLPTFALDAWWASGLCLMGTLVPSLYVGWRAHAHACNRLRCEWVRVTPTPS